MSEVKTKCKYKNEITGWECPYEALEDSKEGFCIFHERRKDKDIEKFNEGIKKILEDKDSEAYHFEGFFFPASTSFEKTTFKKNVFFCEAQFSGERTDFNEACFSGEVADFRRAKFSEGFTSFTDTEFLGKKTIFDFTDFSGRVCTFVETKFRSESTFFNVTRFAAKSTDFFKSEFSSERTDFHFARFLRGETEFYGIKCKYRIDFSAIYIKTKLTFTAIDLSKTQFLEVDLSKADFNLLNWDWKHKLLNELETNRILKKENLKKSELFFKTSETYRQLKVHFHNKRDFAKAGMFHFREQECKRMACELPKDFFKWLFLWILKLSCGYGEKLRNVWWSSVVLIFLFAFGYMFLGLHSADDSASVVSKYNLNFENVAPITTILKDFGTSLIFSVKGFFPLWRFQQYKVVGDFANLVAGIEFLLGAFMIGLFVYVFRRRMEK